MTILSYAFTCRWSLIFSDNVKHEMWRFLQQSWIPYVSQSEHTNHASIERDLQAVTVQSPCGVGTHSWSEMPVPEDRRCRKPPKPHYLTFMKSLPASSVKEIPLFSELIRVDFLIDLNDRRFLDMCTEFQRPRDRRVSRWFPDMRWEQAADLCLELERLDGGCGAWPLIELRLRAGYEGSCDPGRDVEFAPA